MVTHARIVFVNSGNHLTDTMGHDCRYRTADGHPLLPGYWYVVSWPEDIEEPLFDAHAHYSGPYGSEQAAGEEMSRRTVADLTVRTPTRGTESGSPVLSELSYFPDWHCDR